MRFAIARRLALPLLLSGTVAAGAGAQTEILPGRVVLKPLAGAVGELDARLAALGLDGEVTRTLPAPRREDSVGIGRIRTLSVSPGLESAVAERLAAEPWIEWAQPLLGGGGVTGDPPSDPNDVFYDQQWTLSQASDIDMDVPEAWLARGTYEADTSLVIAIVDTGYAASNPDLANRWQNPGEIANGLDDDGNGFVDDLHGYDFDNDDGSPDDDHGHGTAVAGITGGITDNGFEIAGIASGVRFMHLKVFDSTGDFPCCGPYAGTASAAAGLVYATDEGADLVNNSWGVFAGPDLLVQDAVDYALSHDMRLIFAAGNFGETFFFPSDQDGLIAVAAIDEFGIKSNWGFGQSSNYGPWVDICAGGTNVIAPYLAGPVFFSGTSAAAPNASGVAALALSEAPNLHYEDLRQLLMQSAVSVDALNPLYAGQMGTGHVNAWRTLQLLAPVVDLGGGLAGSTQPVLNAWGQTGAGQLMSAAVSGLAPGTPTGLVVGNSNLSLPLFGGVLVPSPDVILLGVADATGRAAWSANLPSALPTGVSLWLQAGAPDAGAPQGYALSNTLTYTGQ